MPYKVNADEISHYGIKGMRWGVRRKKLSRGQKAARTKKRKARRDKVLSVYGIKKNTKGPRKGKYDPSAGTGIKLLATYWLAKIAVRSGKRAVQSLTYNQTKVGAFYRGLAWSMGKVVSNQPL